MGNIRTVLVFDYKIAKEAMASLDFINRPAFFANFSLDDRKLGGKPLPYTLQPTGLGLLTQTNIRSSNLTNHLLFINILAPMDSFIKISQHFLNYQNFILQSTIIAITLNFYQITDKTHVT